MYDDRSAGMSELSEKPWGPPNKAVIKDIQETFHIGDTSGLELISMLQQAAHLCMAVDFQGVDENEVSGPRWALLLFLYMEEKSGNPSGLTPTHLSTTRRVSKNTISSLIRGLENQGMVQRELDPNDLRHFLIQLTPAGRDLIEHNAVDRIQRLNRITSGLSVDESKQLKSLLFKLITSIKPAVNSSMPCPRDFRLRED
jgi:DNA-binding MarR family transcriptional regulator